MIRSLSGSIGTARSAPVHPSDRYSRRHAPSLPIEHSDSRNTAVHRHDIVSYRRWIFAFSADAPFEPSDPFESGLCFGIENESTQRGEERREHERGKRRGGSERGARARGSGVIRKEETRMERRTPLKREGERWSQPRDGRGEYSDTAPSSDDARHDSVEQWMQRIRGSKPNVRVAVLELLLRIDQQGAFIGLANRPFPGSRSWTMDDIDAVGERSVNFLETDRRALVDRLEDPRHRQRVTEIVAGTVRWQRRLRWVLENLEELPKAPKLLEFDSPLRWILLAAAYEMLELDLPAHALNEWVEIAKRVGHKGWASVSNRLLRALQRARDAESVPQPPLPSRQDSIQIMADKLALAASHPTWLVARWLTSFGPKETMALLTANNRRPHHSVRVAPGIDPMHHVETLRQGDIKARPSRYLPSEFLVIQAGSMQSVLKQLEGLGGEGRSIVQQVQDEAAGMVIAVLDPQPGDLLLDCCAAPGGKALFAASRMRGEGRIVALDVNGRRLRALQRSAMQQEFPQGMIDCIEIDAIQYCTNSKASGVLFDKVLVDAPCSGTGVLAKRADLRWRRTPNDIKDLRQLQASILQTASQVVRPGGILVYSTCSLEKDENKDIIDEFLRDHPQFELEPAGSLVPASCVSPDGTMIMLPHMHGTDGAYAARLRRIT